MTQATRALGLFGIGLAAVSAVSWFVAPVHVSSADTADLAAHFAENRTLLLLFGFASAVGNGLHAVFFAWLQTLAGPKKAEQTLARIGLVCLLVEVTVVIVAFQIFSVLAYVEPANDIAETFTDLAWFLINQAAGPVTAIGLVTLTLALSRSGVVRRWLVPYTVLVGGAHLVVAGTVANSGVFAPAGAIAFVVPLLFFSWFAAIGYELVRRPESSRPRRRP